MAKYIPNTLMIVLLISSFNFTSAQKAKDINTAINLCDIQSFIIKDMNGFGVEELNKLKLSCFTPSFRESNSYWMKWEVEKSGILTLLIDPLEPSDDIDFVVFRDVGISNPKLIPIRCMASGLEFTSTNSTQSRALNQSCSGLTGLKIESIDEYEMSGCKSADDNYLKYINCKEGEKYFLVINNHSSPNGINISFDGTCTFRQSSNCMEAPKVISPIVNLYPNPANSLLNIEYSVDEISELELRVLDYGGKIIVDQMIKSQKGQQIHSIDLEGIPAGAYILSLDLGTSKIYKQFVKI